jgi:hypothetical protein
MAHANDVNVSYLFNAILKHASKLRDQMNAYALSSAAAFIVGDVVSGKKTMEQTLKDLKRDWPVA